MDAPTSPPQVKINRWLPYWAVLQADIRQTLRNWVYRTWVLLSVLMGAGYLVYRVGAYKESGIVTYASTLMSDLLRWSMLGSVTLVIVLTAGSISSELGTLADSVLSRGISRYQYFLGKWHARLVVVLSTFLVLAVAGLLCSCLFLHEDLSWEGSLVALGTLLALLAAVISCGVSVSATANSTLVAIALSWVALYGFGFCWSMLPDHYPSPDRILARIPTILRGGPVTTMTNTPAAAGSAKSDNGSNADSTSVRTAGFKTNWDHKTNEVAPVSFLDAPALRRSETYYPPATLSRFMGWLVLASVGVALVGMICFSRRDV